MKSAKRTDASAPTMSSNFAPGKGNAGIDGSTNLFGESNGGASNGKLTSRSIFLIYIVIYKRRYTILIL